MNIKMDIQQSIINPAALQNVPDDLRAQHRVLVARLIALERENAERERVDDLWHKIHELEIDWPVLEKVRVQMMADVLAGES